MYCLIHVSKYAVNIVRIIQANNRDILLGSMEYNGSVYQVIKLDGFSIDDLIEETKLVDDFRFRHLIKSLPKSEIQKLVDLLKENKIIYESGKIGKAFIPYFYA